MKIKCTCENIIVDQTDYLKNKGYLISDTQWFDFWDAVDEAIKESEYSKAEKEDFSIQFKQQWVFKKIWECSKCGKLYIEDKNGELVSYSPDSKKYNRILNEKSS